VATIATAAPANKKKSYNKKKKWLKGAKKVKQQSTCVACCKHVPFG